MYWDKDNYLAKDNTFDELKYWKGDIVITVGPEKSDVSFDPGLKYFPGEDEKFNWFLAETIEIPQWIGFNDKIRVFRRVNSK